MSLQRSLDYYRAGFPFQCFQRSSREVRLSGNLLCEAEDEYEIRLDCLADLDY